MPDKPLIFSTKILPDALSDELKKSGILLEEEDFISVEADYDVLTFQHHLNDPTAQARVFTSQNAVHSLNALLEKTGISAERKKNFAVGYKTTELLEKLGFKVHARAGNAISLAQIIARNHSIKKITFFCGNQSLDDLPEYLESKGIEVHQEIVYRTELQKHKIDTNKISGILFMSPTAVYSFFKSNAIEPEVPCFCIGETTSAAVHLKCDNPRVIAAEPSAESLIQKIIQYFKKNKDNEIYHTQ